MDPIVLPKLRLLRAIAVTAKLGQTRAAADALQDAFLKIA